MKLTSRSEALNHLEPIEQGRFTGKAESKELFRAAPPTQAFVSVVRFETGVRNYWHAHGGGQLLHVIAGEGWIQARGGQPQRMQVGDTVSAEPGEEHWHGAGRRGPMAHLAINHGDTRWLEASPAPPE